MIVEQRDEPSNFIEGQMSAFEFLLSGKKMAAYGLGTVQLRRCPFHG